MNMRWRFEQLEVTLGLPTGMARGETLYKGIAAFL